MRPQKAQKPQNRGLPFCVLCAFCGHRTQRVQSNGLFLRELYFLSVPRVQPLPLACNSRGQGAGAGRITVAAGAPPAGATQPNDQPLDSGVCGVYTGNAYTP